MRRLLLLFALLSAPAAAEPVATLKVSGTELLAVAEGAMQRGDVATAEAAWRVLASDPAIEIRNEARFQLAMSAIAQQRWTEAALLLRRILDEQGDAQRVRLELAGVLDRMGDEAGALRTLRAVQAGALPPEVARMVDRYSAALRSRRPFGLTVDLALAPDSNINRATRSDRLGTVLGEFTLDEDTRSRSGVGMALRGSAFVRKPLGTAVNLLARASGSADLYGESRFNDVALALSCGVEVRSGPDRLGAELGSTWRWYGGAPYARTLAVSLSIAHPLGRRAQVRGTLGASAIANARNPLLGGRGYTASAGAELALSPRAGLGVSVTLERQALRDPAYATTAAQLGIYGYREAGSLTLVATAAAGALRADQRLALFPARRADRSYRASLGATLRGLEVGGFAPTLRLIGEVNRSSIAIYSYSRLRAEIGITRAF